MQRLDDSAIVLTALAHGENGAVLRFLTATQGLRAGFVAGARSKARRALLQPGNRVALTLQARSDTQLPGATLELLESRALLAFRPHTAAMLAWLTELTATTIAEAVPHARLAAALDALLDGLAAGMPADAACAGLARYELLLLEEEGFGLDTSRCALGGMAADLAYVSPHTGRAVSRGKAAGQPWAARLLPLPAFLVGNAPPTPGDVAAALALSGHFLARHWRQTRRQETLRARATTSALAAAVPAPKTAP